MKRTFILVALLGGLSLSTARAQRFNPAENLVFNPTFDLTESPLQGWVFDYRAPEDPSKVVKARRSGSSFYIKNHTRVKQLATYQGRRNVLFIDGKGGETVVESKPIPYVKGARYRCTLDLAGSATPHMYLMGYKWLPGVSPKPDPHIGDLRPQIKSPFRDTKLTRNSGGWNKATFAEFPPPEEKQSKLLKKHLKYLRFFTVLVIVVADAPGEAYIDNVKVTRFQ